MITNFLKLSERLMPAAEEFLIEKNFLNVQKYEINSEEERRHYIK